MFEYRVIWEMDIEAAHPRGAATRARRYQLNPRSTANVFRVIERESTIEFEEEDLDIEKPFVHHSTEYSSTMTPHTIAFEVGRELDPRELASLIYELSKELVTKNRKEQANE